MPETVLTTVSDILNDYGIKVVAELTDNLEFYSNSPRYPTSNATGNLSRSIRFQVKIVGKLYSFELYMADYWKWVDKGRRPGKQPPRKAILSWLTAKRIGSYIYGKRKTNTGKGLRGNSSVGKKAVLATNLQAQRSLAYLIARKIAKFGTKGSHFYTNTFKPGHSGDVKLLEEILSEFLKQDVKVMIEEVKREIA